MHFVYIVRCDDGTLYTGWARNPAARLVVHYAGRGAKYTAARRPVVLVYSEACRSLSLALRREYQIKQFTRVEKERLIHIFARRRQARKRAKAASTLATTPEPRGADGTGRRPASTRGADSRRSRAGTAARFPAS